MSNFTATEDEMTLAEDYLDKDINQMSNHNRTVIDNRPIVIRSDDVDYSMDAVDDPMDIDTPYSEDFPLEYHYEMQGANFLATPSPGAMTDEPAQSRGHAHVNGRGRGAGRRRGGKRGCGGQRHAPNDQHGQIQNYSSAPPPIEIIHGPSNQHGRGRGGRRNGHQHATDSSNRQSANHQNNSHFPSQQNNNQHSNRPKRGQNQSPQYNHHTTEPRRGRGRDRGNAADRGRGNSNSNPNRSRAHPGCSPIVPNHPSQPQAPHQNPNLAPGSRHGQDSGRENGRGNDRGRGKRTHGIRAG